MSRSWNSWTSSAYRSGSSRATASSAWRRLNGQQPGDPSKLAHALLTLADHDQSLLRLVAGAEAIEGVTAKAKELLAQAEASRELGGDLGHEHTNA
ncbi:hypothetical protein ABZY14_37910 [Streptomyces sp. NPDC006617]|uniref:hypothetical protein n=1 Tax=Streptomyces sp. NPDC006617 TaxID=3155354 RepID=UPI0033B79CB6